MAQEVRTTRHVPVLADDSINFRLCLRLCLWMERHREVEYICRRYGLYKYTNEYMRFVLWTLKLTVSAPPEYRDAAAHLTVSSSSALGLFSR
jgi:hypothetical protein